MGLVVADEINAYGISLSNYYVNVGDVHIGKTGQPDMKYAIAAHLQYYASKNARFQYEETIRTRNLRMRVSDITNIYEQIYTELKKDFENYTDDFSGIEEQVLPEP